MMEKTLTLPRLGETMEEGTVLAWSKISGEEYDRGDILLELETDKMVVEVPALEDGKILEILADEGAVVAIGEPIARVEVESSEVVIAKALVAARKMAIEFLFFIYFYNYFYLSSFKSKILFDV